jgi:hypothetical protein
VKENYQLSSVTTQLKLTVADGKKYKMHTLDISGDIKLAKHFSNNKAVQFLDLFFYNAFSIDGHSMMKAYSLLESNLSNEFEMPTK